MSRARRKRRKRERHADIHAASVLPQLMLMQQHQVHQWYRDHQAYKGNRYAYSAYYFLKNNYYSSSMISEERINNIIAMASNPPTNYNRRTETDNDGN